MHETLTKKGMLYILFLSLFLSLSLSLSLSFSLAHTHWKSWQERKVCCTHALGWLIVWPFCCRPQNSLASFSCIDETRNSRFLRQAHETLWQTAKQCFSSSSNTNEMTHKHFFHSRDRKQNPSEIFFSRVCKHKKHFRNVTVTLVFCSRYLFIYLWTVVLVRVAQTIEKRL